MPLIPARHIVLMLGHAYVQQARFPEAVTHQDARNTLQRNHSFFLRSIIALTTAT
jgi:hypothetical protein